MIAYIKGPIVSRTPTDVWIETVGMAYELKISLHTYSKIANQDQAILYTHLQVREDAHVLYGFADLEEKELFLKLVSVSGVGASTALLMLSSMGPEELVHVISSSDVESLKRVKGIGAKTAERVIVDLKDKVIQALGNDGEIPIFAGSDNTKAKEALSALEVLGFNRKSADKVVRKLLQTDGEMSVEELVKQALKKL